MCMYSVANYPVTTETTMTAPINGTVTPPALYTVEQLELIRRLRNSGISREDVANAFDTFDRLDRELGPVYNIPVTLVSYFTYFMDFLGYFFRLGWYWGSCPLQCSMVQYCYSVNCVWEITGMKYMWPVQLKVEDFRRKMESICRNELLFLVSSYWGVKEMNMNWKLVVIYRLLIYAHPVLMLHHDDCVHCYVLACFLVLRPLTVCTHSHPHQNPDVSICQIGTPVY